MANRKTTVEALPTLVEMIVKDYIDKAEAQIKEDVKAAALVAKKEVKKMPPGAGKYHDWEAYSAGWGIEVKNDRWHEFDVVVKNKDWQKQPLTHLLENGHVNRDGSRARAFPHIKPAAEAGKEELMRRLKQ